VFYCIFGENAFGKMAKSKEAGGDLTSMSLAGGREGNGGKEGVNAWTELGLIFRGFKSRESWKEAKKVRKRKLAILAKNLISKKWMGGKADSKGA